MVNKQKYIQKIKELNKSKTGNTLSDAEALNLFENLINLVRSVHEPIPKELWGKIICPSCGKKMKSEHFRDLISVKEFSISGFCQRCQDETFK